MQVTITNKSVYIPERTAAFVDTRGQCVRKTVTLTAETIETIQQLERQHNSSMSAVIRAGIELLSKGQANGKI